jgi:hypothetical protein
MIRTNADKKENAVPAPKTWHLYAIFLGGLFSALVTWRFGQSVNRTSLDFEMPGLAMLLICGTGWVVTGIAALFLLRDKAIAYLGNLGIVQSAGVIMLLPFIYLVDPPNYLDEILCILSVVASSALMLGLHTWRASLLGLSWRWTVGWLLSLWVTGAGWLFFFAGDQLF